MIYLSITSSDAAKHSSPLSHKNLTRVSLLFKKNTTTEFQGLRLRKKTLPLYRCFQKKKRGFKGFIITQGLEQSVVAAKYQ
jgi:hypothetical protein